MALACHARHGPPEHLNRHGLSFPVCVVNTALQGLDGLLHCASISSLNTHVHAELFTPRMQHDSPVVKVSAK